MGDLARRLQQAITSDEPRAVREIRREAALSVLKINATAAVTAHAMRSTVEVDEERRRLSGNDVTRNTLLTELEVGFVRKALSIQEDLFNPFRF